MSYHGDTRSHLRLYIEFDKTSKGGFNDAISCTVVYPELVDEDEQGAPVCQVRLGYYKFVSDRGTCITLCYGQGTRTTICSVRTIFDFGKCLIGKDSL